MTPEQFEIYRKAAELGTIPDDQNPIYLLAGTHTNLLARMLNGDFDVLALARHELANRGLDKEGKWIGFKEAEALHFPSKKPRIQKRYGKRL